MRMRRPKKLAEILNNCDFYYDKEIGFKNNNSIMLEIGMGKGTFITEMALSHPEYNFIGVEKYSSVASYAIKKIMDLKLENVKILIMDASNLPEILTHEINTIYLNFSDPWPKKRYYKRRLTHENYLKVYSQLFINQEHIIMKTDNIDLFTFSLESLINYGYKIITQTNDLDSLGLDNIETEYEKKFKKLGYKINYLEALK